ncbi:hypothetical protein [Heyndrickxia coagulans]|uniref:hypothetical protein n=1 Tax=Heyndrickxia coagulans TaxID=1398 RepID=UPI003990CCF0
MKIHITDEAVNWFKRELELDDGESVRFLPNMAVPRLSSTDFHLAFKRTFPTIRRRPLNGTAMPFSLKARTNGILTAMICISGTTRNGMNRYTNIKKVKTGIIRQLLFCCQ